MIIRKFDKHERNKTFKTSIFCLKKKFKIARKVSPSKHYKLKWLDFTLYRPISLLSPFVKWLKCFLLPKFSVIFSPSDHYNYFKKNGSANTILIGLTTHILHSNKQSNFWLRTFGTLMQYLQFNIPLSETNVAFSFF